MSLISLESLISFFVVLLLRKRYSHYFNISRDSNFCVYLLSDWILIISFSRCYHLICLLCQHKYFNIFVKNYSLLFYVFIILYVKVVRKQPWRDFLLNILNLVIFNIIFTSNLGRVLGSSSLWDFILVRLKVFGLRFYWEWAPTRVFLDLCCNVQNYLFCRTPLVTC